MKNILLLLICACSIQSIAQTDSLTAIEAIQQFQKTLNDEYRNREESPLDEEDFANFQGHDFFPINLDYRVTARLIMTE